MTRMAEACEGATYLRLARLVDWHIREEAYAVATRVLLETQERALIAALWGHGSTSSSDGQHFQAAGRARGISTINLRYGGEPGVKFYTHISDQFAPFATRAIAATAAEALHVLDGLLRTVAGPRSASTHRHWRVQRSRLRAGRAPRLSLRAAYPRSA